jgi:hypothetical protein
MRITRKRLKLLIENFLLNEQESDVAPKKPMKRADAIKKGIVPKDKQPGDAFSKDDEFKKETESEKITRALKFSKEGAKMFLNDYNDKFWELFRKTKENVIDYYKSDKFEVVLDSNKYKKALKGVEISKEDFIETLVSQTDKADLKIAKWISPTTILGLLDYPYKDSKLHTKNKDLSDIAMKYGERFKHVPNIYFYVENLFEAVQSNEPEAQTNKRFRWYFMQPDDLFRKAFVVLEKMVMEHEFLHISNFHLIDLLGTEYEENPLYDSMKKIFLKKENLFSNEERNKQAGATKEDGTSNEAVRDYMLNSLADYINPKKGVGLAETMARIQRLKIKNKPFGTYIRKYKNKEITFEDVKNVIGIDVGMLFQIIDWESNEASDIINLFYEIADSGKKDRSSVPV